MQTSVRATLIISVYKNVKALRLILESLRSGSRIPDEIIISEDGEDDNMRQFVAAYPWFCAYQHLTQKDEGWRKNRALNHAVLAAKHDYLIFIDGDCFLHPRFVEMHLRYAAPNRILAGKRVKLDAQLTDQIYRGEVEIKHLPRMMWARLLWRRGCEFVDEGLFCPFFMQLPLRGTRSLIGSNMSMYRKALLDINGFDERYVLPAVGEDGDIRWRLYRVGYRCFSVRNRAIQYHLYHKENWIDQEDNVAIMRQSMAEDRYFCAHGIREYALH